jgi:hypothetical protein
VMTMKTMTMSSVLNTFVNILHIAIPTRAFNPDYHCSDSLRHAKLCILMDAGESQ